MYHSLYTESPVILESQWRTDRPGHRRNLLYMFRLPKKWLHSRCIQNFQPLLPQEDRKTPSCKIREGQERFFQKHAQMIFEMKVKPSSCSIQKSTLAGSRHWPENLRYDKSFHTHCDLEHFVENNSDIMLSAIHPGPSIWKRSSFFACTNV